MEEPAAVTGDTCCSRAMTLIAAIDQTFPGRYFPRFETNQMRDATPNGRWARQPMSMRRQVSISSTYVSRTSAVAAAIQPHPILSVASRSAAALHCPLSERPAAQTMTAAKTHCAATKTLRLAGVKYVRVDVGVSLGC